MTPRTRAWQLIDKLREGNATQWEAVDKIEAALRDQIEECAKVADCHFRQASEYRELYSHSVIPDHTMARDFHHEAQKSAQIAMEIRALASAPPEPVQSDRS